MCCSSCPDFLLVLLSIIFPPIAALLRRGCGADFLINCGLTVLGYVPGLIHAWYLICKYPADEYEMLIDDEDYPGRHSHHHHVVVIGQAATSPAAASTPSSQQQQQQQQQAPPSYQATVNRS